MSVLLVLISYVYRSLVKFTRTHAFRLLWASVVASNLNAMHDLKCLSYKNTKPFVSIVIQILFTVNLHLSVRKKESAIM